MSAPAETCCWTCPLLQGAQIISSYTVLVGAFSILSLLLQGPDDEVTSETLQTVNLFDRGFHTLAFCAGMKGMIGVMFRDVRRLRVLLLYLVVEMAVKGVNVIFREVEACDELKRMEALEVERAAHSDNAHHHHKLRFADCSWVRIALFGDFLFHTALFAYFAYILWSLIKRLEAGEFRMSVFADLEQELADRAVLEEPWLWSGQQEGQTDNQNQSRVGAARLAGPAGRGRGLPRPFSGAPRNLSENEEQASLQPFQGTAHRLD
mmetsp:Transcript_32409/g.69424  ORF Transcript_32409/g.69424 Transcript_32409/m.69424 type:complete len:264 (-) Transcript_32409:69-860(-)